VSEDRESSKERRYYYILWSILKNIPYLLFGNVIFWLWRKFGPHFYSVAAEIDHPSAPS